jgi:hypothetical protein
VLLLRAAQGISTHLQENETSLTHEVAKQKEITLPGFYHPRAIYGKGGASKHQNGHSPFIPSETTVTRGGA